jgi:osmotically-inducible protein OsmY
VKNKEGEMGAGMTDLELKKNVEEALSWEPSVSPFAPAIAVRVKDGIVTLLGEVESYSVKMAAEDAATRVAGVKAVVNDLEVRLPRSSERTDAVLARAALNILDSLAEIPRGMVKVTVEDGWITLRGTVPWQYQRQAAELAVRSLVGVRGVIDLIEVKPAVDTNVVKKGIEDALKRNAEVDAKRIEVETDGSKITLRGKVRSWVERKEAERVAWQTPGVSDVDNQIEVDPSL